MISVPGQRHRRHTPLIRLLARLGWQCDPDLWTVPCRDLHGRRARLLIRLWPSGITLTATAEGSLYLTALQAGRLRGAARDAIQTCDLLTDPEHAEPAPHDSPASPLSHTPAEREEVRVERILRPTVPSLRARHQGPNP